PPALLYTPSLHDALPISALAIEAARLAANAEQVAVGRERTRMDTILHDTLSSTLFALALKLDGCLHRAESEESRTMLEGVKQHADRKSTRLNSSHVSISY